MKFMHSRAASTRRAVTVLAAVAIIGSSLVACSSTDNGGTSTDTDTDAALAAGGSLTYWSWTPQAESQVAAFEKAYPKVKVDLVNAGTGNDQYTKLQNAITAGSGAPDVVQIEYGALPQFAIGDSLLDLSPYGFGDLESDYTASTWGQVVFDGKIYGLPQDSGPTALFYDKAIFDQYGIDVPTTWDEYLAAAQKLHAADPTKYITSDTGDAGFTMTSLWQAGGKPFTTDGTKVTVNLQDEGTKRWADFWNKLVQNDLVAPIPGWSDDWYRGLADGGVASLVIGAWMPGVLAGSVPDAAGDWRVAPVPTWDGTPASSENGGGAQSVTKQSKNPALAAGFLKWLNNSPESLKIFTDEGGFPSTNAELTNPDFLNYESDYFGGQKINEVLGAAAADVVPGWSYLPFQVYANSIFNDTAGQAWANKSDLNDGLVAWQDAIIEYGNQQGFTVSK